MPSRHVPTCRTPPGEGGGSKAQGEGYLPPRARRRAERSGSLHKRSAEDWGDPLRRAIGAEPLSEVFPCACMSAHRNLRPRVPGRNGPHRYEVIMGGSKPLFGKLQGKYQAMGFIPHRGLSCQIRGDGSVFLSRSSNYLPVNCSETDFDAMDIVTALYREPHRVRRSDPPIC
jgi:hypothetical protein